LEWIEALADARALRIAAGPRFAEAFFGEGEDVFVRGGDGLAGVVMHADFLMQPQAVRIQLRPAEFLREFDQRRIAALADVRDDVRDRLAHVVRRLGVPLERGEGLGKTGLCVTKNLHARAACSRGRASGAM
jgi:hypothetical protein